MVGLFGGKCWAYDVSCTLRITKVNPSKGMQLVWDFSRHEGLAFTGLSMLCNVDNC